MNLVRLASSVLTLALLACASNSAATGKPALALYEPPQPIAREARLDLRMPSGTVGRTPVNVKIEVMIDATGRPDMSTFKVTGFGASQNRDPIAAWIQQSTFRPAQRDGQPVPRLFTTRLTASVSRIAH